MSERSTQGPGARFRHLLEAFEPRKPQRGTIVTGRVLSIDEDAILMDIGAHQDAVVPNKELRKLSERHLAGIAVGDRLPAYILRTSRFGGDILVSLERGLEQQDWDRAEQYLESGETIQLEIVGENRGGALVEFGRLRGFVPNSHLPGVRGRPQPGADKRKRSLIGTQLPFKVIEVNPKRRRLVLSARQARKEHRVQRLRELQVGQVIEGTVVNLVDFGAFVDLGGIDGLLHISELSHRTDVEHPSEELALGEVIEVLIKDIDIERERIGLSRKALIPSPWETAASRYEVDSLVEGTITNVAEFGAFLRLPDGIEGMIHNSEVGIISPDGPAAGVREGERVLARIVSLDPEEQRMRLSLREVTHEDKLAWEERQGEE